MIWGNPEKLAIEAQLEPNALMPVVGANIAGRIRCYVGGEPFGNWDEPLCVLGAASDHLLNLAASPSGQWHPLLEALTPRQRFSALDDLIYESSVSAHPSVMSVLFNTHFLTNISEAFDYTKSFILSDPDEQVQVLVDSPRGFFHAKLSRSEFVSLAEGFSNWVKLQEHRLIGGGA